MRDALGKVVAKANLPSKMCIICVRPFTWRKAWERSWNERDTCSTRCLGEARARRRDARDYVGGGSSGSSGSGGVGERADGNSDGEK